MGFVSSSLIPAGVVFTFAGNTAPSSYLICDGSAVSRTTYAALFNAIGIAHGQGDGSTTFNLPDYRGRFLRGVDGSSSNDPDRASRTAMNTGGNTGNAVGSIQADLTRSHTHNMTRRVKWGQGNASPRGFAGQDGNAEDATFTTDSDTGGNIKNETRPLNAYVNYIIKF